LSKSPQDLSRLYGNERILPGLPLTKKSSLHTLLSHNVTVGIGIEESWSARNTRFDLAWLAIDAGGDISKADAIAIGSANIQKLLGGVEAEQASHQYELVATEGGDLLQFESKVVAIISPRRGVVDML